MRVGAAREVSAGAPVEPAPARFPDRESLRDRQRAVGAQPEGAGAEALGPVAFVDDYLPYLVGVDPAIHSALIMRGPNGTPNGGEHLRLAASRHGSLLAFARWWGEDQK